MGKSELGANLSRSNEIYKSQSSLDIRSLASKRNSIATVSSSTVVVIENYKGLCGSDPITRRGKKVQLYKVLGVMMVPILAVILQNTILLGSSVINKNQVREIQEQISTGVQLGTLIHHLQIERGVTALYISSEGDATVADKRAEVSRDTDTILATISRWPENKNDGLTFTNKSNFQLGLNKHRYYLGRTSFSDVSVDAEITYYSDIISVLLGWVTDVVQELKGTDNWKSLVAYSLLMHGKESVGVERARGSAFFVKGKYT